MKTQIKLLLLIWGLILLFNIKVLAQGCFSTGLITPPRTEIQTTNPYFDFTNGTCVGSGSLTLSGVGINMIHPLSMFDVNGGDIDVSSASYGYRIAEQYALWLTPTIANNNTWVGYSGNSGGAGLQCTYVGYQSGFASSSGSSACSFLGVNSGYYNQAQNNTFVGFWSGYYNDLGDGNTCVGEKAGWNTNSASGAENSFFGLNAGQTNGIGGNNMAIGAGADFSSGTLNGVSAIGAGTIATTDYTMILGNNINVGIGMSNIAGGPTNRLEISNYSNPTPDPTHTITPTTFSLIAGSGTATGASGLQFRDLNTQSYQYGYVTNQGFLTLDDAGNIVYMAPPPAVVSGTGSFSTCPAAGITGDEGLDLSNFNLYFAGNSNGLYSNNVLLGYSCATTPPVSAKLNILQNSGYNPITAAQSSIGLYVENDDLLYGTTAHGQYVIGIESNVPYPVGGNCQSIAGYFNAPGSCLMAASGTNYGILVPNGGGLSGFGTTDPITTLQVDGALYDSGEAIVIMPSGGIALFANSATSSGGINLGVQGDASNSSAGNFGVTGQATGTVGPYNVGVYGLANTSNFNIGVMGTGNTNTGDFGGYFIGDVFGTGGTYDAGGVYLMSDSTIKNKVNSVSNAISIIKKLQPKTYYLDSTNKYKFKLDTFMHYGFIAQAVQRSVPCLVRNVSTPPQFDTGMHITVPASTINALDYNQFAAILTAGFQEQLQIAYNDSVKQKQTNDSLRYTLDSLRNAVQNMQTCLNQLCDNSHSQHHRFKDTSTNNNSTTNIQEVILANANEALLYQNIPNPFSGNTKINYYLPETATSAAMLFYDNYGNKIKEVQLSQTGNGTLNINPENLTAGIYSYSLVVNGKVVDTKRMILQK